MSDDKDHEAIWREISAIRNDISKVSSNILQMTQVLSGFLTKHEQEHVELGEALRSVALAMEAINNRVLQLSGDQAAESQDVQ
jgi:hypothetical protein